jgi:hypothetical protein
VEQVHARAARDRPVGRQDAADDDRGDEDAVGSAHRQQDRQEGEDRHECEDRDDGADEPVVEAVRAGDLTGDRCLRPVDPASVAGRTSSRSF